MFEFDFNFQLKRVGNQETRAIRTFQVLQMQLNSPVFSDLQLSKEQSDVINKSVYEIMDFSKRHYKKTAEDLQNHGGANYKELRQQYLDGFDKLSRDKVAEFNDLLSQPQSVVANRLLGQLTITQFGLANWLLSNRSDESEKIGIKLNNDQIKRTRQQALKILKRISEESREFETRLNRSAMNVLDKTQKESLNKLIGPPLKSVGGNPEITAAQLRLNLDMIRRHLN